ncbi:MAG: hypothetical protein JNG90_15630 [Planctomycetaceae bacterium]|nr:hypothetical protein [Planctomycetaceae bacterium]
MKTLLRSPAWGAACGALIATMLVSLPWDEARANRSPLESPTGYTATTEPVIRRSGAALAFVEADSAPPPECNYLADACGRDDWHWLDTLSVFLGLDGSKQPQDFGINAQFGGRTAVNWGAPLWRPWGLGFQIGTAIDATADAVQVVEQIQGSTGRTQNFTTVGVFQRTPVGVSWGLAYDFLYENYYDTFRLGQWRLNLGYDLTRQDTIGVWSALRGYGDDGFFGATPIRLVPITQTNMYYRHTWANAVQTTFWGGLANGHGQVNGVLGDQDFLHNPFVFGAELFVPLTDRLALFGQGNFITPSGSGTVDAYLGVVFYPRGGVRRMTPAPFAPLQTVAAPTNFAVDLRRR